MLPAPAGNPLPIALGRALLHIDPLADRTLVIDRHPTLLHIDWRRRRRSPIDDRRLRLSNGSANGGTHGKAAQSTESHSGTRRQAIARGSRLSDSKAGNQRQSSGRAGNKTEDPHDQHPRKKGGSMSPSSCHEIYCSKPL
jgi:hypothetical protein